jgi:dipeptidase E
VSGSGGYLDYAEEEIGRFLGDARRVLFVPFALADHEGYAQRVRERLGRMSYQVEGLHHASDARVALKNAEAIFIGGGNTFRLLKGLYDLDLLETVRARVEAGVPYLGSSAGSNVAAPTIRTTNDMPIVQPPSFDALGLVPFQINPHYLDADPNSTHMGETREERILQFLEENTTPVLGLREGAWVRVEGTECRLGGKSGARWFCRGQSPVELENGATLHS